MNKPASHQTYVQIWNGNENKHLNIMSLKIENTQRQKKPKKNHWIKQIWKHFFYCYDRT